MSNGFGLENRLSKDSSPLLVSGEIETCQKSRLFHSSIKSTEKVNLSNNFGKKKCPSISSTQSSNSQEEEEDETEQSVSSPDFTLHKKQTSEMGEGDFKALRIDELLPDLSQIDVYSSVVDAEQQQGTSENRGNSKDEPAQDATTVLLSDAKEATTKESSSKNGGNKRNSSVIACRRPSLSAEKSGRSFLCRCPSTSCFNWLFNSDGKKKGRVRYLILLISILCCTLTRSNELSFNFTVICMTSNSSVNNDEPIPMSAKQISATFAGGGIGAILMVLPVVYALHYVGPRIVFASLLMWSALATFALPFLARVSPLWMVPARIVQGLAVSSVLPVMGCISAEWAPISEIGKFMTLLSSAGQLSQILTMPLSAQLCIHSGWSSVFHAHGLISAVLAICFFLIYRSSPRNHPCVKAKELEYITEGTRAKNKKERRVPYKQIMRSKAVWAVWIAFLGNSFGFQLIVQFMPTFLNKVLNVPIARTGMIAIIPPITQLFVKVLAGYASDKISFISELVKLRIFNTLAMVGCGLFLLPLGYLPAVSAEDEGTTNSMIAALFCFTGSISCLGMVACSSMKSATLIARNFTHFVMGVVQLVVCVGMLLIPVIVSVLAPTNSISEWRYVFFLVFIILSISNVVFCRYCSAVAEDWALLAASHGLETGFEGGESAQVVAATADMVTISTPCLVEALNKEEAGLKKERKNRG